MANIDIQVSSDLQELFDLPDCSTISLPSPAPITIKLPGGGTLSSFSDISKGIPTDCAMTFSLLLQLAPFLASIDCLIKVLKFIQTAVDVIKSITSPFSIPSAIPKIVKAAVPVVECALSFTPAGLVPFIKDLLCLIIKFLNCFLQQMRSLLMIMTQIESQLNAATSAGNIDLITALQCAQGNAQTQAAHFTAALQPLAVILQLAGTLMQIVGIQPISLPAIGNQTDLASLQQVVKDVQQLVATLQIVADALGGCDS
jgi:hypothetical protein